MIARSCLIAVAVWIGGAAALVTSAEIDRRLHPGDYPLPYEAAPEESSASEMPSEDFFPPLEPGVCALTPEADL